MTVDGEAGDAVRMCWILMKPIFAQQSSKWDFDIVLSTSTINLFKLFMLLLSFDRITEEYRTHCIS